MNLDLGASASFRHGAGSPRMTVEGTASPAEEHCLSVLLLEDDAALRQMLVWELSDLGYLVHPVGCCGEARAAIDTRDFDLALVDVGLPDGDGVELAAELIVANPKLRIVLCSGRPGSLARARVPSEVVDCLTKPVSIGRLDALFRRSV